MRVRVAQTALPVGGTKRTCSVPHARSLLCLSLVLLAILASAGPTCAQTDSKAQQPYAAINREAIGYAGPGRETAHDLPGPEIKIGLLAPLQGPRKAEGEALRQAAQMALEDEAGKPLPGGRRLAVVVRDETGLWGRGSSEIVRLVFDDQAVALITSPEGNAAHLAEQVGNRVGVPVLTLSSDSTTTQINIPWLFRIVPNDAVQTRIFAEEIYRKRAFQKVLLITERNHDGRVGGEEFDKAARALNASPPASIVIEANPLDPDAVVKASENMEAVVLWTGPETVAKLVPRMREALPSRPIYLCRKAAQMAFEDQAARGHCRTCSHKTIGPSPSSFPSSDQQSGSIWVVSARPGQPAARTEFEQRYEARTGTAPSLAAAEIYDAVRLIAAGLRKSGPNRARLRDSLAKVSDFAGVSGNISFDGAGNNQAEIALAPLK
jgi:branched-chain amino acid transport system substrate-binding protein